MNVPSPLSCPTASCINHQPVGDLIAALFRRSGKTHSGSDRWQCRACGKTFAVGKSTRGHKKPHTNAEAFGLIVNKVSISRITEILGLSYSSVYGKIDFIHEQCRLFAADRESRMPEMALRRLYLSTDRQDYLVNWGSRKARKTIQLTAIGTADLLSGYVFGLTPNFDPAVDPEAVEADWQVCGDARAPSAMRKHARIWTRADYGASVARSQKGGDKAEVSARDDLDAPELMSDDQQLPVTGAQVHADYLMHGHYCMLRWPLQKVEKVRFFLDEDAGLLHACMGAFMERVRDRTADVIQVSIQKDLTIDMRRQVNREARTWFEAEIVFRRGKRTLFEG